MSSKLALGITISAIGAGAAAAAIGTVSGRVTALGKTIGTLKARQKAAAAAMDREWVYGGDGVKKYAREVDRLDASIKRLSGNQARLRSLGEQHTKNRADMQGRIGDAVAAYGLGRMAAAPIGAAVSFENAMLGVAKQLDGARDASGKLTPVYHDMGRAIHGLAEELPSTTTAIAEMTNAGLRMGVAKDQVLGFVRESSKMATAFELPEGELAEKMGKIATLYKTPIPQIGALADSINYLDDNAISKGGDIVDFLQRVGGVAGSVKITDKNMAAIGSTLLTLGEHTETASTATNAFFQKLAAADKGAKHFKEAMAEIGMSTQAVQSGMQTDALGTMQKVLEGVNKLPKEKRLGVLVDMVGLEHSDTIAKLATNTEELRKQIGLANSEAVKGSMDREFAARMQTTTAQAQVAKNRLFRLGANIGAALLPGVNATLGVVGPVFTALAGFAEQYPMVSKMAVAAGLLGASFLAVGAALSVVRYAWTGAQLLPGMVALGGSVARAGGLLAWLKNGLLLVAGGMRAVELALVANPIGAIVAAIAVSALLIYKYWEPISGWFRQAWADVKAECIKVWPFFQALPGRFKEWGGQLLTGLIGGIKAKAGAVKDAIVGLGSDVKGWFANTLGIKSPSRVFMGLGGSIGEGTIAGILGKVPGVRAAGKGLATAALAGTVAAGGGDLAHTGKQAAGGGQAMHINYAPVINVSATDSAGVRQQVDQALKLSQAEFEKMLTRAGQNKARKGFV